MSETKQLNVEIPADLHRKTKAEAAFDGKTLERFIVDLLTEKLENKGERSFRGALGRPGELMAA